MTFTDYRCKYCGQARAIPTARAAVASFIRCDACYAISALTRAERLALVAAAANAPTGDKRRGAA
jgi:hypothetical protein